MTGPGQYVSSGSRDRQAPAHGRHAGQAGLDPAGEGKRRLQAVYDRLDDLLEAKDDLEDYRNRNPEDQGLLDSRPPWRKHRPEAPPKRVRKKPPAAVCADRVEIGRDGQGRAHVEITFTRRFPLRPAQADVLEAICWDDGKITKDDLVRHKSAEEILEYLKRKLLRLKSTPRSVAVSLSRLRGEMEDGGAGGLLQSDRRRGHRVLKRCHQPVPKIVPGLK